MAPGHLHGEGRQGGGGRWLQGFFMVVVVVFLGVAVDWVSYGLIKLEAKPVRD